MNTDDTWAPETNMDIHRIWGAIKSHKIIILGIPILMSGLAVLGVSMITPIYSATATVMIENVSANVVSIEQVYGMDRTNAQYYDTQFEILKSRPLAEDVVAELNIVEHPEYLPSDPDTGIRATIKEWLGLESTAVPTLDPMQRAVRLYHENLEIEPVPRTQLVNVIFRSSDRQLAMRAANAHANAYIRGTLAARVSMTETAMAWMSEKIDDLQMSLSESETRLQAFREKYGVIDYGGLKALPSAEIQNLTTNLALAQERVSLARTNYLHAWPDGGDVIAEDLAGSSAVLDDPVSQDLQLSVVEAQHQVDELSKRLGPNHPTMIDAQSTLERAQLELRMQHRNVAEKVRNEYEAAMATEREIAASLRRAKDRFQAIGRTEAEFIALERDVRTNRELYDMFYSRIKETAQTGDLTQAEARVLSPAVLPVEAAWPDRNRIVLLTFAGSLFLAIIATFVSEASNDRIDASSIEKRVQLPLLTMVPFIRRKRKYGSIDHLHKSGRHRAFRESIRTLRTNIALKSAEELNKIVLVTSALSNEGKSTVSVNLAHAFGQMEKVLLIDADFRKPSIARRLGLSTTSPGFVEFLASKADLEDCIVSPADEGFDVLLAGSVPDDPLQLLASRRYASALRALRIKYDRIIIDSPPTLAVSDTPILSAHADSVIFVTKSQSTSLTQVRNALNKLRRVSAPLAGVAVNQWDERQRGDFGEYGYYGYYGQEDVSAAQKLAS